MRNSEVPGRRGWQPTGFTLVELLVAMAITAIISIAIFGLFDSTSEALYEADSLAQSVDSARFTLEKVRSDFKQAGAFATPDSAWDPQVRPEPGASVQRGNVSREVGDYRVAGLVTYPGWQNYAQNVMPGDVWTANQDENGDRSPEFDGIVLMGAYDYPFLFEVGDLTDSSVRIYDHPRGLDKLARRNLFDLERPSTAFNSGSSAPLDVVDPNTMQSRVLRLRDPNGFYQFIGISSLSEVSSSNLQLTFTTFSNASSSIFMKPAAAQDMEFGFPVRSQKSGDERFYASLIDAYWYRVIQDPANPKNFQLIRQRLDAWEVIQALTDWTNFDPSTTTHDGYTVIAERVVDFQVWFDCTESQDGTIEDLNWTADWDPPDGTSRSDSDPHHGCLDPNAGQGGDSPRTAKARIGHVRLSIRTENERSDLQHNPFPEAGKTGSNRQLETFDVYPDQEGATRVYTTQADFELTNYAVRNLTPN